MRHRRLHDRGGRRTGRLWGHGWGRPATAFAAALALVAWPADVTAQRPGEGPPRIDREEMQQRIRARFGEIVQAQLGLEEEEQRRLAEVMRTSEEERRELRRRGAALRERLRGQAPLPPRGGRAPLLPEERAREILDEMAALREEEGRLFQTEQARLLRILTPGQLVRFYALREALAHRVARLRRGPGTGGPPEGRPGRRRSGR